MDVPARASSPLAAGIVRLAHPLQTDKERLIYDDG